MCNDVQIKFDLGDIGNVTLDIPKKGKLSGTIQRMIELRKWGLFDTPVSELTNENRVQLQQHQIFDYLIGNTDYHAGNFGMDDNHNIVAFDKAQALSIFRFRDPNSDAAPTLDQFNKQLYGELWNGWLDNKYEMDFMAVKPFIEKIEELSETAFLDIFRPYAEGLEKQLGISAEEFLDTLKEWKYYLRSKVEAFYKRTCTEEGDSI